MAAHPPRPYQGQPFGPQKAAAHPTRPYGSNSAPNLPLNPVMGHSKEQIGQEQPLAQKIYRPVSGNNQQGGT